MKKEQKLNQYKNKPIFKISTKTLKKTQKPETTSQFHHQYHNIFLRDRPPLAPAMVNAEELGRRFITHVKGSESKSHNNSRDFLVLRISIRTSLTLGLR